MLFEYESPKRSVKQALTELQLKTKLLEEERDYFVHLQHTSAKAFNDHREELDSLLAKERQYAAAQEERLQAQLKRIVSENSLIETQHSESKRHANGRLRQAVEEFQAECEVRERRLTNELDIVREEAVIAHRRTEESMSVLDTMRVEVDDLRRKQVLLQEEVQQLTDDNQRLTDEVSYNKRASSKLQQTNTTLKTAKGRRAGSNGAARGQRVTTSKAYGNAKPLKAFIPSGAVSHDTLMPATSNVNAVVQTIRNVNIRSPKRSRSQPQHSAGHQLDGICRSLIADLLELRAEYDALCRALNQPDADSLHLSTRLRQVFTAMDQKMLQLKHLRKSQNKLDDECRLNDLLHEVARENSHCTTTLKELVSVIRHPM